MFNRLRLPHPWIPPVALGWCLLLGFAVLPSAIAQPLALAVDARPLEVGSIDFVGNEQVSDEALRRAIVSRPTPGGVSQFLFRTFGEKLGSGPEYFDEAIFVEDHRRLVTYYQDHGFFDVSIDAATTVDTARARVILRFVIAEGRRALVDSVFYRGLEHLPPALREQLHRGPIVQPGMPFDQERVAAEIRRVLEILADHGYPTARKDDDQSGAYRRLSTGNLTLVFAIDTGDRYQFGDANVVVEPPRPDIVPALALRQLDFRPGDVYSREKRLSSERNLNRLGLFETARIEHPPISDTLPTAPFVPIDVVVRPRVRNELAPEVFVSSAEETGEFNLGIGLGFIHRNFFGDARIMDARARVRTQSIDRLFSGLGLRDTIAVGAAETQFRVVQPYVFTRSLSGTWSLTLGLDKQRSYLLSILKSRIGLSNQFATYTFGFFDWTLERVSPDLLTVDARLREEDRPQFNSIFTLTLQRDRTNEIFSPTSGFFNSISIEESGVLPRLLYGDDPDPPLEYTQYYKVTLFGRWYRDVSRSRFSIAAIKLRAGYQDKYGESRRRAVRIPLNRRFFAGGSASVRGWRARELGAMPDDQVPFGGNVIFDGSAELRVNHFRNFGKVGFIDFANVWGVYFIDVGNTWSAVREVRARDVAVAGGLGFRYETFFGPFRIDYGFRFYDPKAEASRRTVFQRKFFAETFGDGVLHFGIGHAF